MKTRRFKLNLQDNTGDSTENRVEVLKQLTLKSYLII